MTERKSKLAPSGAPATKWFITALSLAAVLGGWVSFTLNPGVNNEATSQSLANNLMLEPIPTVVLAPEVQDHVQTNQTVDQSQISQPALRSVSAPPRPAPVTVTRSSR